jgi:chromate transport protein ChrA
MAHSRFRTNLGLMLLAGFLVVAAGVVWYLLQNPAETGSDYRAEQMPLSLWAAIVALVAMAIIYLTKWIRDRSRVGMLRIEEGHYEAQKDLTPSQVYENADFNKKRMNRRKP